jgi:4-aminobutyrate aminotransferase-like enzyme
MLAIELVVDRETREPAGTLAAATVDAALDRGLVLLACGLYGNVLRVLAPLTISDEEAAEGLDLLEAALVDAGARAA